MLTIIVPGVESFDDETQTFINPEDTTLVLEHSLVALSKWESQTEKSFLAPNNKTPEDTLLYIKAMCLTEDVPEDVFNRLSEENVRDVNKYIEAKMTATTFHNLPNKPAGREIITAEIIYHWMIALQVPFECETWHLARLFTLIKVLNAKNAPKKKVNAREAAAQQRALNAQRRQQMGTRG